MVKAIQTQEHGGLAFAEHFLAEVLNFSDEVSKKIHCWVGKLPEANRMEQEEKHPRSHDLNEQSSSYPPLKTHK